jgi:hypothetical protein
VEEAVEQVSAEGAAQDDLDKRVPSVWAELSDLRTQMAVVQGRTLPAKVRSASGLQHIVRDVGRAWCGYRWSARGVVAVLEANFQAVGCKTCAVRLEAMGGTSD